MFDGELADLTQLALRIGVLYNANDLLTPRDEIGGLLREARSRFGDTEGCIHPKGFAEWVNTNLPFDMLKANYFLAYVVEDKKPRIFEEIPYILAERQRQQLYGIVSKIHRAWHSPSPHRHLKVKRLLVQARRLLTALNGTGSGTRGTDGLAPAGYKEWCKQNLPFHHTTAVEVLHGGPRKRHRPSQPKAEQQPNVREAIGTLPAEQLRAVLHGDELLRALLDDWKDRSREQIVAMLRGLPTQQRDRLSGAFLEAWRDGTFASLLEAIADEASLANPGQLTQLGAHVLGIIAWRGKLTGFRAMIEEAFTKGYSGKDAHAYTVAAAWLAKWVQTVKVPTYAETLIASTTRGLTPLPGAMTPPPPLPDDRIGSYEVGRKTGMRPETLKKLAAEGKFPAWKKLGDKPNSPLGWIESEVDAWVAGRKIGAERRVPPVKPVAEKTVNPSVKKPVVTNSPVARPGLLRRLFGGAAA